MAQGASLWREGSSLQLRELSLHGDITQTHVGRTMKWQSCSRHGTYSGWVDSWTPDSNEVPHHFVLLKALENLQVSLVDGLSLTRVPVSCFELFVECLRQ